MRLKPYKKTAIDAIFSKVTKRRTGGKSNSNIYQGKGKVLFSYLPDKAFILPGWHTYSIIGFKDHTRAKFCDTGLNENGTSILCCH